VERIHGPPIKLDYAYLGSANAHLNRLGKRESFDSDSGRMVSDPEVTSW